jgi:LysM repeat protein
MSNSNLSTYVIKPGDNFFLLAKRLGLSLDQIVAVNPGVSPELLEVGQQIKLPKGAKKVLAAVPGKNSYQESTNEGEAFLGRNLDTLGVKIGNLDFDLKRVIDNETPHEIHIILPKTEIRSVTRGTDCTVSETFVLLENVDIIHSPRQ